MLTQEKLQLVGKLFGQRSPCSPVDIHSLRLERPMPSRDCTAKDQAPMELSCSLPVLVLVLAPVLAQASVPVWAPALGLVLEPVLVLQLALVWAPE